MPHIPPFLIPPLLLVIWMMLQSLRAWFAFARDKERAINQETKNRIPETKLLSLALTGGWLGAKLAQKKLRHKTRKEPFRRHLNLTLIGPALMMGLVLMTSASIYTQSRQSGLIETPRLGGQISNIFGQIWYDLSSFMRPETEKAAEQIMPRRFGPGSDSWNSRP